MTSFAPADAEERAGLVAHLQRLVGLDDRGAVRLQGHGAVLGVWGGPPLDVVTLRPVGLAGQGADGLDVTVSVRRLLDRLVDGAATDGVDLPDPVPGPAWAGLLPPRSGWQALATVPTPSVHDAVLVAVEGFRRRVDELPEGERSAAALEAVAAQVWARPVVAGIPLRAAHAAELTGLLGREGEVVAYEAGPWWRLGCPGGSVALRRDSGSRLGLDLGVWALGQR